VKKKECFQFFSRCNNRCDADRRDSTILYYICHRNHTYAGNMQKKQRGGKERRDTTPSTGRGVRRVRVRVRWTGSVAVQNKETTYCCSVC
jgi:hypothetical protein